MTAAHLEVTITMKMSLAEALDLELLLNGGKATATTEALGRAVTIQLQAVKGAISAGLQRPA
jgi:hypothetical protein